MGRTAPTRHGSHVFPPPLAVVAAVLSSCTAEAAALVAELAFECSAPLSSVDDTIWI